MGLKWSSRLSAWTGTIDDPTGNHVFALGKYANGLNISVEAPSEQTLCIARHLHGAELRDDF